MNFGPKPTNKQAIAWSKPSWPITHSVLTFCPRFFLFFSYHRIAPGWILLMQRDSFRTNTCSSRFSFPQVRLWFSAMQNSNMQTTTPLQLQSRHPTEDSCSPMQNSQAPMPSTMRPMQKLIPMQLTAAPQHDLLSFQHANNNSASSSKASPHAAVKPASNLLPYMSAHHQHLMKTL